MESLPGIPVIRDSVFVVLTLVFFDQHAGRDPPAIACPQVTALMEAIPAERATGNPDRAAVVVDALAAVPVDLLPVLFTDNPLNRQRGGVVIVAVLDVVNPPKVLLSAAPGVGPAVWSWPGAEALHCLPNAGQALWR
jgi:hypothetical protein